MEFVEGETLAAMMQRGPLPIAEALRLASEIAEGLANAHARGLVHRDIKPANVMVTPHGAREAARFRYCAGGRRRHTRGAHEGRRRSAPMGRGGTPHYMSPEQATGAPVTARADLFALGVVIYECVTGRLPSKARPTTTTCTNLIATAPKPMHSSRPNAPEETGVAWW
jgi:serine/threonine-protein kinase